MRTLIIFFLLCLPAQAASVQLAWDAVTSYEDGVPLEEEKIVKYEVFRATNQSLNGAIRVGFDLTAADYTDTTVVPKNTYYYFVRAYLIDTLPSENSNVASARIWPPFKTAIRSVVIVR